MKRQKSLTREQKDAVYASGYEPESWVLEKEMEFYLKIVHKKTGKRIIVDRYAIPKKMIDPAIRRNISKGENKDGWNYRKQQSNFKRRNRK